MEDERPNDAATTRNLIVCCDGTGNEIGGDLSNVLKLYRIVRKTDKTSPRQICFYDPGVGTLARPNPWIRRWQETMTVLSLATGYGLDENVLRAYRFLVQTYRSGDRIFLFGFSRGAYTARVLAGLIRKIGLLAPEQVHLADAGLGAYKHTSAELGREVSPPPLDTGVDEDAMDNERSAPLPNSAEDRAGQFARIVSPRWPVIHFMGLWDTVASVLVPHGLLLSFEELLFTRENPGVRVFRQANAIDERRTMFRLYPWQEDQTFRASPFVATKFDQPQDSRQVWFPGVHADVGGGYPETQSQLSKYPLIWMIEEACRFGLTINQQTFKHIAWGSKRQGSPFEYVEPDYRAAAHDSLTALWRPLEFYPKKTALQEWPDRVIIGNRYFPRGEPRCIPEGAVVHESAFLKRAQSSSYNPENLGDRALYAAEPMPTYPT